MNDLIFKKLTGRQNKKFILSQSIKNIETICDKKPQAKEIFKFISLTGGLSSISFISWIGKTEIIENLVVSTLRIGEKQFRELNSLKARERLKRASFYTSSVSKADVRKGYNYFDYIEKTCQKNDWDLFVVNNHSKIILIETKSAKYILETSSNLNENPKIEQYSFTNDFELFDFYSDFFEKLKGFVKKNDRQSYGVR